MELNGLKNQAAKGQGVKCAFCHPQTQGKACSSGALGSHTSAHVLKTGQPPMRGAILGSLTRLKGIRRPEAKLRGICFFIPLHQGREGHS